MKQKSDKGKQKLPLVSIITVVRNGEKVLEKTINSVMNQTYPAIEYIIIDGASTDGTIDIIKKYPKNISRWISQPDKSHFDAMNKGLKLAKGKYVWFMNAGDQIHSKKTLEKALAKENDSDIYYGDAILIDPAGRELGSFRGKNAPNKLTWKAFRHGAVVCHQSFIVRVALAPKYDFEKYPICADTEWMICCLKKSKKIINTKYVLCKYLRGGISAINEEKTWIENYRIFKRHYGFWQNLIIHSVLAINYVFYKLFQKRF